MSIVKYCGMEVSFQESISGLFLVILQYRSVDLSDIVGPYDESERSTR